MSNQDGISKSIRKIILEQNPGLNPKGFGDSITSSRISSQISRGNASGIPSMPLPGPGSLEKRSGIHLVIPTMIPLVMSTGIVAKILWFPLEIPPEIIPSISLQQKFFHIVFFHW